MPDARRPDAKLKPLEVRQRWHTPLIPGFGRQRQTDLCEFKATLGYTKSTQKEIQVVVAHTFNPSPRESPPLIPALEGI